jgi:hypothetical protein
MAGRPVRMMPAFSRPMLSRSAPGNSMWSRSTLVMMAQSASMMLTASSRPPRPTSRITTSSPARAITARMASVVNSK